MLKYNGEDVEVKSGQYGPYLTYKKKNYSIYKSYDAENLSEEDIKKIIEYKKKSYSKKTFSKNKSS